MGNCMTCSNEESSSMDFIYQIRKRKNNEIKQELLEKQMTRREMQILKRIENELTRDKVLTENNRLRRTEFVN